MSRVRLALCAFLAVTYCRAGQDEQVGPQKSGSDIAPTGQLIHPAGDSLTSAGRPTDLALAPDGKMLYVKYNWGVLIVDTASWKVRQQLPIEGGNSATSHGIVVTRDGRSLYVTASANLLSQADISSTGSAAWVRYIPLAEPGGRPAVNPCGVALSPDEATAYVCLSLKNALAVVDLKSGKLLREIPVGIAPFDVMVSPTDGRWAYVSNWGGRPPLKGERTANSEGSAVLVDKRGIASSGTVSVVDLQENREVAQIETGLHPSGLALSSDGRLLYVANANSDTVSVIETQTRKVADTFSIRPDATLPFGSAPNALALSKDNKALYVANGGNNAVAVVTLNAEERGRNVVRGFIPTGWFPGALATDDERLYVANVKGIGSRLDREGGKRWHASWFLGSFTRVDVPSNEGLTRYTARVLADGRVSDELRAIAKAQSGLKPVPVPERVGEPSVFDHVVYIIKENRTYDQFFGDLPQGNGDTNLCIFGREVTPNHHQLAEEFVLLDNFYCNGVISADGHRWVTEGNVAAMMEKSFAAFMRGDAFGLDPLNFSSSGFIWDNVVLHGLSFRNYGELMRGSATPLSSGAQRNTIKDLVEHPEAYRLSSSPMNNVDALLAQYSCPTYPGWELNIPDVLRARAFLQELESHHRQAKWPNFIIIHLPNDHAGGKPTPRAQAADNDLALGRIVEGISKSKFWPTTCIFVIEDDPQSGFDHVDGHRSICLAISPYTKRHKVISHFYNQTSVLHTMELMLGIPPMTQMEALSPAMTDCFTNVPDLTPYQALPNEIPLDETPKPLAQLHGKELYWAKELRTLRFDQPDQVDDDLFNRAIWHSIKGVDSPYPAQLAGSHGRGLTALHLKLAADSDDD